MDIVTTVKQAKQLAGNLPFRAPHHSVSAGAITSELAWAMGGVIFLDEVDQFAPAVLAHLFDEVSNMKDLGHPHAPHIMCTVSDSPAGRLVAAMNKLP